MLNKHNRIENIKELLDEIAQKPMDDLPKKSLNELKSHDKTNKDINTITQQSNIKNENIGLDIIK